MIIILYLYMPLISLTPISQIDITVLWAALLESRVRWMILVADGGNAVRCISVTFSTASMLWFYILLVLQMMIHVRPRTLRRNRKTTFDLLPNQLCRNDFFSGNILLNEMSFILISQQIIHLLIHFICSSVCSDKRIIPDHSIKTPQHELILLKHCVCSK